MNLVDELRQIQQTEQAWGLDREARWHCHRTPDGRTGCGRSWLFPAYLTALRCPF